MDWFGPRSLHKILSLKHCEKNIPIESTVWKPPALTELIWHKGSQRNAYQRGTTWKYWSTAGLHAWGSCIGLQNNEKGTCFLLETMLQCIAYSPLCSHVRSRLCTLLTIFNFPTLKSYPRSVRKKHKPVSPEGMENQELSTTVLGRAGTLPARTQSHSNQADWRPRAKHK